MVIDLRSIHQICGSRIRCCWSGVLRNGDLAGRSRNGHRYDLDRSHSRCEADQFDMRRKASRLDSQTIRSERYGLKMRIPAGVAYRAALDIGLMRDQQYAGDDWPA